MYKSNRLIIGIGACLFFMGTAHATMWYVHPDSALNTIQAGLDSCSTGDTVLVGPGVYNENLVWPSTQGIDLRSELGRDTTIIDGGGTGRVIQIITGVDSTTMISGFTIQNGDADHGAGIRCFDNSSPIITDNTITLNQASVNGGGIVVTNSSPIITGNTITGNTADTLGGGIACFFYSSPTITNNTITGNESSYGGGGIGCYSYPSPIIADNTITGNTAEYAGGGIGFRLFSSPTITHNTIEGNTAPRGGGIGCDSSSSGTIDSCTISGNNGDGVCCDYASSPVIYCCNISSNTGYGVRNLDPGVTLNADSNWWGDSTGPYHPTTNPSGLGDSVSDYVDYDPWLTDSVEWVGIEEHESSQTMTTYLQISPNPFTHRTQIGFTIQDSGYTIDEMTLKIYDAAGRLVKSFRITPYALRNTLSWDGRDDQNRMLSSGVYFLKFETDDYSATEKLLFIR